MSPFGLVDIELANFLDRMAPTMQAARISSGANTSCRFASVISSNGMLCEHKMFRRSFRFIVF